MVNCPAQPCRCLNRRPRGRGDHDKTQKRAQEREQHCEDEKSRKIIRIVVPHPRVPTCYPSNCPAKGSLVAAHDQAENAAIEQRMVWGFAFERCGRVGIYALGKKTINVRPPDPFLFTYRKCQRIAQGNLGNDLRVNFDLLQAPLAILARKRFPVIGKRILVSLGKVSKLGDFTF